MTFREAVVQGSNVREHIVQFFDTAESRGGTVADYVRQGLEAGAIVLVVARPEAWTNVAQHLGRTAVNVGRAMEQGRLVVLDAEQTLAKFTRQSWPDAGRFNAVIGRLVGALAGRGRLRIYGEMVDVLAADAQFRAAIALEDLWNDLARSVPFTLFCGYSAVHFGSARNSEVLRLICRCHSTTRVDQGDDLAAWLLSRAD